MTDFKVPSALPQDLLLIRDLVEENSLTPATTTPQNIKKEDADSIASSGDESTDSEVEVEANLFSIKEDEEPQTLPASSESESDESFDSSDSESESEHALQKYGEIVQDIIDDDDSPVQGPVTYTKTTNEIIQNEIMIPDILEVDPSEPLEKIGEIFSILNNNIVIVKGITSPVADRASEKALDSDTLLVFEDRRVMGFIYETFGPTNQPLYQVRFNDKFPLDVDKARVSCPVFHMPHRSKFVFVNQLKQHKGSDASNAHDEEPGVEEVEFSDDEEEAAYKRSQRMGRSQSREAFSRQGTPSASRMRNQDFLDNSFASHNPYDEHGPYDMDYGAGPSRPLPIPYDDPYSDSYNSLPASEELVSQETNIDRPAELRFDSYSGPPNTTTYDRNVSSGNHSPQGRGRGRGRGRDRSNLDRGRRRGRGRGSGVPGSQHISSLASLSSSSFPAYSTSIHPQQQPQSFEGLSQQSPVGNWSQPIPSHEFPQQDFTLGFQNPYMNIQPHINPRFANQWGFNLAQSSSQYGSYTGNAGDGQWHENQDGDTARRRGGE